MMACTRVISGKQRQVGESRYRKKVELTGVGSLTNRGTEAEKRVWNDSLMTFTEMGHRRGETGFGEKVLSSIGKY